MDLSCICKAEKKLMARCMKGRVTCDLAATVPQPQPRTTRVARLPRLSRKLGPARFPTSRDKWAKSVTKGKMVNNFPTTTLMKNQFALKGRLGCSEHLRANRFLINPVFEELFKRLCLSYHVCSGSLSSQWRSCWSQNGV